MNSLPLHPLPPLHTELLTPPPLYPRPYHTIWHSETATNKLLFVHKVPKRHLRHLPSKCLAAIRNALLPLITIIFVVFFCTVIVIAIAIAIKIINTMGSELAGTNKSKKYKQCGYNRYLAYWGCFQ